MLILKSTEQARYIQQIKLSDIGTAGQLKLKSSKVLCVGAGGLGSPLLLYLAAAGIGTLGIIDDDAVEWSNLHRQILYQPHHLHQKKAIIAAEQIRLFNPDIITQPYVERLTKDNAKKIISQYDVVADCSDNFATRYLINDMCVELDIPFVSASISQFQGQCATFLGKKSPCYRCLFPDIPSHILNCSEEGVLGVLPGLLGTIQATEILKYILNIGSLLIGRLLTIDSLTMSFREYIFQADPHCPACGENAIKPALSYEQCTTSPDFITSDKLHLYPNSILLDVRGAEERAIRHLENDVWIPLPELSERLNELDPEHSIVVYCHAEPRSIQAALLLQKAHFKWVRYLKGGIRSIK